jgi:DNA-binding MarR family transcriptional regulator
MNMDTNNLQENLYWRLVLLTLRAKRGFIKIAEKHELNVMQMLALCQLREGKPMPMHQLADIMICDASSITGAVDALHAHGYIKRQENPQDRRTKLLSPTPKGFKLCREILAEIPQHHPINFNNLSAEQLQQFGALLELASQPAAEPAAQKS